MARVILRLLQRPSCSVLSPLPSAKRSPEFYKIGFSSPSKLALWQESEKFIHVKILITSPKNIWASPLVGLRRREKSSNGGISDIVKHLSSPSEII